MKILLLYIKHALHMMREEKLFSGIYIAGTALAIAFTMVMAIVYYVKLAKIYPEVNRDKMVYIDNLCFMDKEGRVHWTCHFSEYAFEKWFAHAKNVEYVAPIYSKSDRISVGNGKRNIIGKNGKLIEVEYQVTNHDFFNIFKFEFLKGRPITREDVEQHNRVAVITNDLAEQLFGKDVDPVGKMIGEEGDEYRICGVVKGASPLTPVSYAQVYVNYSYYYQNMVYDNESLSGNYNYIGGFSVIATVKDNAQYQALKQELDATAARWSQIMEGEPISLTHTMCNHAQHVLEIENELSPFHSFTDWDLVKPYVGLFFILLFVPAINLCGMVAGRMERRLSEMGVRKAFGAKRNTLLWQVVWENMVLTLTGGIVGLVLSWVALYVMRDTILTMFFDSDLLNDTTFVSGEVLFAPLLFLGALLTMLLLNLMAAVFPAWLSLRKPIVESMMEKR